MQQSRCRALAALKPACLAVIVIGHPQGLHGCGKQAEAGAVSYGYLQNYTYLNVHLED